MAKPSGHGLDQGLRLRRTGRGDACKCDRRLAPHDRVGILDRPQKAASGVRGSEAAECPCRLPSHAAGRGVEGTDRRAAAASPCATRASLTANRTSPFGSSRAGASSAAALADLTKPSARAASARRYQTLLVSRARSGTTARASPRAARDRAAARRMGSLSRSRDSASASALRAVLTKRSAAAADAGDPGSAPRSATMTPSTAGARPNSRERQARPLRAPAAGAEFRQKRTDGRFADGDEFLDRLVAVPAAKRSDESRDPGVGLRWSLLGGRNNAPDPRGERPRCRRSCCAES